MVKRIGVSVPQSAPIQTDVEGAGQSSITKEIPTQQSQPQYDASAKSALRREHSMAGQVLAAKLHQQLSAQQSTKADHLTINSNENQARPASSMVIPRMGWEVDVKPSASSPVPVPYPNITAADKDKSGK